MYKTYYDKLQPHFGQENLQLHYIDTDSENRKYYQGFENFARYIRFH